MAFKQAIASLFLTSLPIIVGAVNPIANATPKPEAFVRDDQLWTLTLNTTTHKYELPVCWENLATINDTVTHPTWKQRRINTLNYINAAWGDLTNFTTNPTGNGSASLIYFVDKGQCPLTTLGFPGVRILVSSTSTLPTPIGNLPPPYVKALGKNLANLVYGVVLDFDMIKNRIYTRNDTSFKGCQAQSISEENCFKAVVIHEFGHVLGMSHEQNRNDQPLPYKTMACGIKDPSPVLGQITFGNLRIGAYDDQSIMAYCNLNRLRSPVLSVRDKVALRVFYGRMPSISFDLGYPVITIPVVLTGSTGVPKSMTLSDPTNTGKFAYIFSIAPTTTKSSVPATYLSSVLTIPYLKETSFGKVKSIQSWAMALQLSTNVFRKNTSVNLYTATPQ
ncbi:MAG: M12 family metallopeptidase [Methylococcales bacterium]